MHDTLSNSLPGFPALFMYYADGWFTVIYGITNPDPSKPVIFSQFYMRDPWSVGCRNVSTICFRNQKNNGHLVRKAYNSSSISVYCYVYMMHGECEMEALKLAKEFIIMLSFLASTI